MIDEPHKVKNQLAPLSMAINKVATRHQQHHQLATHAVVHKSVWINE